MMGNGGDVRQDVCRGIDEALEGLKDVLRHELLVSYKSEQTIQKAMQILRALKGVLSDEQGDTDRESGE